MIKVTLFYVQHVKKTVRKIWPNRPGFTQIIIKMKIRFWVDKG